MKVFFIVNPLIQIQLFSGNHLSGQYTHSDILELERIAQAKGWRAKARSNAA
jgi:hypothetical protein